MRLPHTDLSRADLGEVLRRCHRDELVQLGQSLGIRGSHSGHRDLARACEMKLRWAGSHKLWAFVFGGFRPIVYPVLLKSLCRRMRVTPGETLEATEQAIVKKYLEDHWADVDDEARLALWERGGLEPPAPAVGSALVKQVEEMLGARAQYVLSTATTPGLIALGALPFVPNLALPFAIWLLGANDKLVLPAVLEVCRLRQVLLHRVTVGVVGSPSSGKDAAIKAIFGVDHNNVSPIAGSTTTVQITKLPDTLATFIVNTPGLGDVVESVTEEARQVLDHIDVYLYIVNAQGGVQKREKDDYRICVRSGRPVLAVVNKVDTIREHERERYLEDARQKLGASIDGFAAAAFDPLPQLAEAPIGVEPVRDWIRSALERLGKQRGELGF